MILTNLTPSGTKLSHAKHAVAKRARTKLAHTKLAHTKLAHTKTSRSRKAPRLDLSALRHQLLTPLNHIVGYSELLLEDAPESGFSSARQHLTRIRETARGLVRFIQTNFVPLPARGREKLMAGLYYDLDAPLHTILQAVGAITSDPLSKPDDEDVMRIGRAAAELLGLVHARVPRPTPDFEHPAGERVPSRAASGKRSAVGHAGTEPGRILVVDDNKSNRDLLVRRLKREGHRVTESASGAEALALLTETPQDVVLLDVLMPKLDGFQVLEKIKADPALAAVPVIVVSALDEVPGIAQSIDMGAEDYLFKPIDPVLLRARVRSSLEKKRMLDREKSRARELEEAYQRVQLSEERLRLALESARAAAWEWNLDSRGLNGLLAPVHAGDRERVREQMLQAAEHRTDFREQMRISGPGASTAWVESLGTLHFDAAGRPDRMIGLNRDITIEKQTQDDLRRSNQDFQRFALAASHDLQEPLQAASGNLRKLKPRLTASDEARSLDAAIDSLSRMSKLVTDLLDYSQMSPAPARKRPVAVESVLALVLADLKPSIDSARAVITCDKLPVIPADFTLLHRLLQNLISNAIKYRGKDVARVHVGARRTAGEWVFSVADNGIGIDPKYAASIFGLFRRLHGRDIPGSGLGLAISKRIIERLGGRIWMESAPGKGSTFYFTVPE